MVFTKNGTKTTTLQIFCEIYLLTFRDISKKLPLIVSICSTFVVIIAKLLLDQILRVSWFLSLLTGPINLQLSISKLD